MNAKNESYSVTAITALIRRSLESEYANIQVEGEVSNVRPSSTGHLYFTLKDENAALSAVMFRSRFARLDFAPEDGQLVIASGSISVYEKRGVYQLVCERIEKAGIGGILLMLEERKKRLAAEGLFAEELKKPLPLFPARVAVVTSPTGAAIRDILNVTRRRNAGIDIVILPAPVQGDGAAEIIARQIDRANELNLGEVLIVGRGGGSLEDLLPFSEECVVRAIRRSRIPVISAVGHEVDVTLSDLAADVRAPTPSAAAEIVCASRTELLERVGQTRRSMESAISGRIERVRLLLNGFSARNLERNFRILVQPFLLRLDDAKEGLLRAMTDITAAARHRLELAAQALDSRSPYKILSRGYSLVTDSETNRLITDAKNSAPGKHISIRLAKGSLGAAVTEVHDEEL
ncbi:MAG: exodeoxyribonuclease VII large subunit [Spirochaetales bacterium]|nr:exodeoxyribonuclease VII large subunit [Spirochaetales bacterium]